ncbi:hypothetical protein KKD88_00920 [Patescibacteria group bacterium]|nr:hypothetical protein [Patescibacteria group bacterium]MBU1629620.1 hypothetical protein [Patescibacteria group bacterium]
MDILSHSDNLAKAFRGMVNGLSPEFILHRMRSANYMEKKVDQIAVFP